MISPDSNSPDSLPVAPLDPELPELTETLPSELRTNPLAEPEPDPHRPLDPNQFSLGALVLLLCFLAVGMAGLRWFQPGAYAFGLGLSFLTLLVALAIIQAKSAFWHLLCWSLLILYFFTSLVALLQN